MSRGKAVGLITRARATQTIPAVHNIARARQNFGVRVSCTPTNLKAASPMPKVLRLPARSNVKPADTWDLAPLCESDAQWEELFARLDKMVAGFAKFRGKLSEGAKTLVACLKFDSDFDRLGERVGGYAHLKATEDQANGTYQAMVARFANLATRASQAASYI